MNPYFASIEEPTLLLNEQRARANIHKMADKAHRFDLRFRPHFKTHQSAVIGEWFRYEGVSQITVSSVEMAEYFAVNGWQDITIAFSLNIRQMARIKALAERIRLSVLVENIEGVRAIAGSSAPKMDVWLKIDIGAHRTGLDWQDVPSAAAICREVAQNPQSMILRGLLTHSGHTYAALSKKEIVELFDETLFRLHSLKEELRNLGFEPLEISVGDTPGCTLAENFEGANEIRPGNFVFYDVHQLSLGVCEFSDIAVAVACPVVAVHPEREEVVIYGGAVHLSKETIAWNGEETYGLVATPREEGWGNPIPDTYVARLSQEHGILHYPIAAMRSHPIFVGDLALVIPAHSCLTVQALGQYHTLEGRKIRTMLHPFWAEHPELDKTDD